MFSGVCFVSEGKSAPSWAEMLFLFLFLSLNIAWRYYWDVHCWKGTLYWLVTTVTQLKNALKNPGEFHIHIVPLIDAAFNHTFVWSRFRSLVYLHMACCHLKSCVYSLIYSSEPKAGKLSGITGIIYWQIPINTNSQRFFNSKHLKEETLIRGTSIFFLFHRKKMYLYKIKGLGQ